MITSHNTMFKGFANEFMLPTYLKHFNLKLLRLIKIVFIVY